MTGMKYVPNRAKFDVVLYLEFTTAISTGLTRSLETCELKTSQGHWHVLKHRPDRRHENRSGGGRKLGVATHISCDARLQFGKVSRTDNPLGPSSRDIRTSNTLL
jgi:hypothetical protein